MGRRRKKRRKVIKKIVKIPSVFECPRCASRTLSITIKRKSEERAYAVISCGTCGLLDNEDFEDIPTIYQEVDVYSKFLDLYLDGKARIKSINEEESKLE